MPPMYPRYPQPCPRLSHQFESDVIATLCIENIFLRRRWTISDMLRKLPSAMVSLGPELQHSSSTEKQTEA